MIIKIQIELEIFKISGINDRRIVDGFLFLEKISNKRAFLKINSNLSAQLYVNVNKKMYQQIFCFFEFYLKTFYKKFISYFWKPRYLKKKIIFKIMPVYILNIDNNSFRKKDCLQLCYR